MTSHDTPTQAQQIPWQEMLAPLFRQRRLIMTVVATGVVTVTVLAWLSPPSYRATARILIEPKRTEITVSPDAGTRAAVSQVGQEATNAQVALLRSPDLVREVLSKHPDRFEDISEPGLVSMLTYPLRAPGLLYRAIHDLPEPARLDRLTKTVSANIEITPVTRSNLIEISYNAKDPVWAATLVNELVGLHIDRFARRSEQSGALQFYQAQRELLGSKLEQAKTALQAFRQREGTVLTLVDEDQLKSRIAELQLAHINAEAELAEARARAEFLGQELEELPQNIASESRSVGFEAMQTLQQRILDLKIQRSELLSRYAPTSTKVRELDRQIDDLGSLLTNQDGSLAETASTINPAYQQLDVQIVQARSEIAAAKARIQALGGQIADYRDKMVHLERISSEKDRLENEVDTMKTAYLTYMRKEEEARFSDALDESKIVNLSIAESARVPSLPEPSKKGLAMLLGLILSLCAGIALAFIRDRIDPTIKSSAQARRMVDVPVLTEIPS